MLQNLRAYFIFCVTAIKWKMCIQKEIEVSSMSQKPRLSSTKICGDISLVAKI